MNMLTYTTYLFVTLVFIVFVLRAVYYCINKTDPLKAIIPMTPKIKNWFQKAQEEKEDNRILQELS